MFKPLHNYVLLERIEEENITAGGTQKKNHHGDVSSPLGRVFMMETT